MVASVVAAVLSFSCLASPAHAQQQPAATLSGRVVDQADGLPLSGAQVETVPATNAKSTTDSAGRFTLVNLPPGIYALRILHAGYQTTLSDSLTALTGGTAAVTLALARQQTGATTLREIGRTSVRASQSLQRSSVIYHSASVEAIERSGFFASATICVRFHK